jgi:hypothetical protein
MNEKDSFQKQPESANSYSVTVEGFTLTGEYDYEEGFEGDSIDPPYAPMYNVFSVFINGLTDDVFALIDPAVIQSIERKLSK